MYAAGSTGSVLYPFEKGPGAVPTYHAVFRTVRIPIHAFLAVNPNLDIRLLEWLSITPIVREAGRIVFDDLEIKRLRPFPTSPHLPPFERSF